MDTVTESDMAIAMAVSIRSYINKKTKTIKFPSKMAQVTRDKTYKSAISRYGIIVFELKPSIKYASIACFEKEKEKWRAFVYYLNTNKSAPLLFQLINCLLLLINKNRCEN